MGANEWIAVVAITITILIAAGTWATKLYLMVSDIRSEQRAAFERLDDFDEKHESIWRRLEKHDDEIGDLKTGVASLRARTS